ncbi:hypothetical protein [Serratia nematodiphila]|uniref:hypothetical protein n=1 Tax=Serratia nematodiphila TaxID=458197 RepID=UPI0021C3658D|nr:hypothetical protein [Serratia nematodiphila]
MSRETGGNAFPYSGVHKYQGNGGMGGGIIVDDRGMSLRDYFAAKAMQAIVRRYDGHSFGGGLESPQYKELSDDAYCIADAMLKARNN